MKHSKQVTHVRAQFFRSFGGRENSQRARDGGKIKKRIVLTIRRARISTDPARGRAQVGQEWGAQGGEKGGTQSYRAGRAAFPIVSYILITIRRIKDKYTTAPVRPLVILLLARRLGEDDPRANCRGVYRACLVNIIANRYHRSPRASPRLEGREAMEMHRVAFLSTLTRRFPPFRPHPRIHPLSSPSAHLARLLCARVPQTLVLLEIH